MAVTDTTREIPKSATTSIKLVDCDVHCTVDNIQDLMPYLPDVWQRYVRETGFRAPPPSPYPKIKRNAARDDAHALRVAQLLGQAAPVVDEVG